MSRAKRGIGTHERRAVATPASRDVAEAHRGFITRRCRPVDVSLREFRDAARERGALPGLVLWTISVAVLAVAFGWSLGYAVGVYAAAVALAAAGLASSVVVPDPLLSVAAGCVGVAVGCIALYALATRGEDAVVVGCFGVAFGLVGCYALADGVRRYRWRAAEA